MSQETKLEWFMLQPRGLLIGRDHQTGDIKAVLDNKGSRLAGEQEEKLQRWWGHVCLPSMKYEAVGEMPIFSEARAFLESFLP